MKRLPNVFLTVAIVICLNGFLTRDVLGQETYSFSGPHTSWRGGFVRYDFVMDMDSFFIQPVQATTAEGTGIANPNKGQKRCLVIVPKQAAPGRPWVWRGCYWDHQPQTEVQLLKRGFHVAYISIDPDQAWDAWYTFLTEKHGLSPKPAFLGMSRGGINAYQWATQHPDQVSCIYADNPGIRPDDFKRLDALAQRDVPLLNICGNLDFFLEKHTLPIENYYRQRHGRITVVIKEGAAHHPHSLRNPKLIADWIEENIKHETPRPRPAFADERFIQSSYYSDENTYFYLKEEDTYATGRGPGYTPCYDRYEQKTQSRMGVTGTTIIVPHKVAEGKPWVFRSEFMTEDARVEQALLALGYHIVTPPITILSGAIEKQWDAVYDHLVKHGFHPKAVMVGSGAPAGDAYAWAINNPEKVAGLYAVNPVLRSTMTKALPLDHLEPLAQAGIPLLHICGDQDPWFSSQTLRVQQRYEAMGGEIKVIVNHGEGHYPLVPRDVKPVVDFVKAVVKPYIPVASPKPVHPLPSARQLAWHELETYAFVHFNMNTFTNREWGFGDEDPALFNPTELDCHQWARVCKAAGFKGIIITAKHHDGFCLWPSAYTEHSVKHSPWKNGQGDVVRELADACQAHGLKMGIYLSPWDRNHADYGTPAYLTYFRNQLRELLTNYGDIYEVWFDGANGGTGYYGGANEERRIDNRTYYDWENTRSIVRDLQPQAVMFSDGGPDVRWVGTEEGWARETNWCLLKRADFAPGVISNIEDLRRGQADGTHWLPAEVDVSIRPGWFYHPAEDHKVKTLPHLLDIYYNSVGRNASLLINFPVDPRGLIHEKDVEQLQKLTQAIRADFAHNLAAGMTVTASHTRGHSPLFEAKNVTDDNLDSYWSTDDEIVSAALTFQWDQPTEFNRFLIQEDIRLGQRVKAFSVEAWVDNAWLTLAKQSTVGRKRILRFPNVTTHKVKLTILDAKACPVISNVEIYKAPKVLVEPRITRDQQGLVGIKAFDTGLDIYYTTNGQEPTETSTKYQGPFRLEKKATVKARVIDPGTQLTSEVAALSCDILRSKWNVVNADTLDNQEKMNVIFDGQWETAWTSTQTLPVDVVIDLGESVQLKGFTYLPEQARANAGIISHYQFWVSQDGKHWGGAVSEGEFSNIKNSPIFQRIVFQPVTGRYLKLRAVQSVYDEDKIGVAEFDVITE